MPPKGLRGSGSGGGGGPAPSGDANPVFTSNPGAASGSGTGSTPAVAPAMTSSGAGGAAAGVATVASPAVATLPSAVPAAFRTGAAVAAHFARSGDELLRYVLAEEKRQAVEAEEVVDFLAPLAPSAAGPAPASRPPRVTFAPAAAPTAGERDAVGAVVGGGADGDAAADGSEGGLTDHAWHAVFSFLSAEMVVRCMATGKR